MDDLPLGEGHSASDVIRALKARVRDSLNVPGLQRIEVTVLEQSSRRYKTAALLYLGPHASDIRRRELRVRTWSLIEGSSYEFNPTAEEWHCEDGGIEKLTSFLETRIDIGSDDYRHLLGLGDEAYLIRAAALAHDIGHSPLGTVILPPLLGSAARREDLVDVLAKTDRTEAFGAAVQLKRQTDVLAELRKLVENPQTKEQELQSLLSDEWWIFGGRYVERVDRRKFTVLDELDIPLLRSDGVLHIVELKLANIPRLVRKHRNHFTVGDEVNKAMNQAANYLRAFDEQRAEILATLRLECRRAYATVVIGHPMHNGEAEVSEQQVRETIRTYGSHLNRIEIMTYEDLLNGAEQSISFLTEEMRRYQS
jgi:hypothetical protein